MRERKHMIDTILAGGASVHYNLGSLQQIPPGEGRVFRVDGSEVAVFRSRADEIYATQALCPHKAGPLADGLVGSGKIVCPLHAYVFDLVTGQALDSACEHLRTYPVFL